jgi:hypothetical protein
LPSSGLGAAKLVLQFYADTSAASAATASSAALTSVNIVFNSVVIAQ